MKKIINFLWLIIMVLVCVGCNKVNNEVVNNSNIDSNNKYIEGLVIYKDNNETLAVDNNQVIYRLKGLEAEVDSYVKIFYDGQINKDTEVQDITIKNVENVNDEFKLNSNFNNCIIYIYRIQTRINKNGNKNHIIFYCNNYSTSTI